MRSKRSLTEENCTFFAILLAAGSGSRVGAELPKALLPLKGEQPLFMAALRTLLSSKRFARILLIVPQGYSDAFSSYIGQLEPADRDSIQVVHGGSSRRESVCIGLQQLRKYNAATGESTYVAIHDSARPFLSEKILHTVLDAAIEKKAVTLAVPVIDSLKIVDADLNIAASIDRSTVWQMQTPQVFEFELIYQAHQEVESHVTDDTALVESRVPVGVVPGDESNFKVTTHQDYIFARFLSEQPKP